MIISVEISMYPLNENYRPQVEAFLEQIRHSHDEIDVRTNNMSTRLFGEFELVTTRLNQAMKFSMQNEGTIAFVCKYLSGDTRELEGYA